VIMTGLDLLSPCDNAEVDFCRHYRRRDRWRRARAIAIGGATSGKGCINYYTVSIYGTVLPIRPTITVPLLLRSIGSMEQHTSRSEPYI